MLAPVLARLEAIPGVTSARVESSGGFFWLALDEAADEGRVTELARDLVRGGANPLSTAEAREQTAAHERGDPWLTAREVVALSFVEARVLSVRLSAEAQRRAGCSPDQRSVIAEAIRAALFAAIERVHAEGGRDASGWIYEEWPAISAAATERCRARIPPGLHARIAELLPRLLAR